VIARKGLVTNIDDDQLKNDFSLHIKYQQNRDFGPNLHPMQAVMTLNDMRTLRSKMDLMSRSAMKVAEFLETQPTVESVQYLGLPDHPLHDLARRYMWLVDAEYDEQYGRPVNRYGHLLSFCVRGGAGKARLFFDALQRIWRATDLGRIKERRHHTGHIHPSAAGGNGAQHGEHPPEHGPPLCGGRAPGRHHRRPGAGAHQGQVSSVPSGGLPAVGLIPQSHPDEYRHAGGNDPQACQGLPGGGDEGVEQEGRSDQGEE
jgi:hypothetical protein